MGGKTGLARPWYGPQASRGYVVTYRPGQPNVCPGCSGEQWHVGRQTAECAYCLTALPLADPDNRRAWALGRDRWRLATA